MEVCQSHRSFWSPTFASVGFTSQSSRNALQKLQILLVDCSQQDSATETVQVVSSTPRWAFILRRPWMTWKSTSKRTLSLVKRPIVGHLTCSSRSIRSACCKTTFPFNTWCELGFKEILEKFSVGLADDALRQRIGKTGRSIPCATTRECAPFKRLALWKRSKMPEMLCRIECFGRFCQTESS